MLYRFTDLTGTDYSQGAVELAGAVAERSNVDNITFLVHHLFTASCLHLLLSTVHTLSHLEVMLVEIMGVINGTRIEGSVSIREKCTVPIPKVFSRLYHLPCIISC